MAQLKIFRETVLPSSLEAYSIYLIAPTDKPDYVEMYVTNHDGSKAKRHFNETDVKTMIAQVIAAGSQLAVVDDITERDKIRDPKQGNEVFVLNATGDSSVKSGGARYLRNNNTWLKIAETESMDLQLSWNSIQGGPSSTPTQIDSAVSQAHTHANKTQLDKIGEDAQGNLTYGGNAVKTEWQSVGW